MGKLIVIEGLDGAGKDTQINFLKESLKKEGFEVAVFRELDANPLTKALGKIVLSKEHMQFSTPRSELFLWASIKKSAQVQLVKELAKNDFVIMNRYVDSFIAMQGVANGCTNAAKDVVHDFIKPDLTIYLDRLPKDVYEYVLKRGNGLDFFESKGIEYHQMLFDYFRSRIADPNVITLSSYTDRYLLARTILSVIKKLSTGEK